MKRYVSLGALTGLVLFLVVTHAAHAQQAPTATPAPTPVVVTATPIPQIVVVTATPSATPSPKTFWGEHGRTIVGSLIGLVVGGILTWLLKPVFEQAGKALADGLGKTA